MRTIQFLIVMYPVFHYLGLSKRSEGIFVLVLVTIANKEYPSFLALTDYELCTIFSRLFHIPLTLWVPVHARRAACLKRPQAFPRILLLYDRRFRNGRGNTTERVNTSSTLLTARYTGCPLKSL